MLPVLLCFLLLIGVPAEGWANRVLVPVDGELTTLPLQGFLHASLSGASPATPEEALTRYRSGGFEPLPAYLGRGYRQESVWLGFDMDVRADAPRIVIVDVGPAYLDEVRAYQINAAGVITPLGRAGDQVPPDEIFMRGLRPAFAIRPADGSTVLLEIRTSSTQAAIVKLHAGARYPALQSAESLLFGVVLAISVVMALGALALYRLFRDRAYLVWMAYVLLTGTHFMALDGVISLYADWDDRSLLNLTTNVNSVLLFATGALLLTRLFQFEQIHPWLDRLFSGWAVVMVVPLLAIPFLGAWVVGVLGSLGLPLYVLGIVLTCVQIVRGNRASRLYGPVFILHLFASLLNILAILGLWPFSDFTLYAWQLTSLLNLLSLQVSMFMRMREQLAETARQRRHFVQALNSKNAELEHQVAERTASLAQALRDVQQAESEQRQLLSMASHEFRTPAAMIKTSLDSLRFLASQIPVDVAQRLRNIEHASTRMIDLSNSLINQDRLRELALRPNLAAVDLRELMADVVARYGHDPASASRVLMEPSSASLEAVLTTVRADAALISIALHNLIDNALQHAGRVDVAAAADSAIRVSLDVQAEHVELRVADRGPGIPDGEKAKIFERFYSLAKRRAAKPSSPGRIYGDGLGLSIVHAIARAHGGAAYAADNPGGGAVLGVCLPLEVNVSSCVT